MAEGKLSSARITDHITANIGANRVVLALSMARLGDAIGNSILFVVIPLYVADLPAPWFPIPETVLVGLLISLYGLTNALLQPLVGAWIDRASRRKPFIQAGLVLMALGTLAFLFPGRFSTLLLIRGLQGIGVALTIPASLALMASATEKGTRGGSMGIYTSMRMIGLATTTFQLTGFRAFQGLASAAIAAPAFSLAADLARSGGEGRQLSFVTTGFGLGIALGPLIAGVLGTLRFELPFIIVGALTIAGAWIVYRYVPETVHRSESGAAKIQRKAVPAKGD